MHISRMMNSAIKLVTLDVNNTLIRVVRSPGYQYAYIGHKHGVDLNENVLNEVFLKYYKQYSHKYPNFGAQSNMSAYTWWSLLVKDCFHAADASISEDTLNVLADDLYIHYTTSKAWEFLPGAFDAIKDLRQYPVKIGVISNWDHHLYEVLKTMKLQPFFDFVLPSTVAGVEKPNKAIFQLALQIAGCCSPQESVHLGDNIEKDFNGARNMGMNAYLLATSGVQHSFVDQSLVVNSVQEFVNRIRPDLGDKIPQCKFSQEESV